MAETDSRGAESSMGSEVKNLSESPPTSATSVIDGVEESRPLEPSDSSSPAEKVTRDPASWRSYLQERLYDRSEEEALLRDTFEQRLERMKEAAEDDNSHSAFLLITGPSGTGKTRLAQTLRDCVQAQGGYFVTIQFDQLRRPEPYPAFVQAVDDFANLVLDRGEADAVRATILEAVGDDRVGGLVNMIPGLAKILGDDTSSAAASLPSSLRGQVANRFQFAFRLFVRSISSVDTPRIVFLDDLQYADPCSLELMKSLMTDPQNTGVVFAGTCCDSAAMPDDSSHVSALLEEIEDGTTNVELVNVSLGNLSQSAVTDLVTDVFDLDQQDGERFGALMFRLSKGNHYYLDELLRLLQDEGMLQYDTSAGRWDWDSDEIAMMVDELGDFLLAKLERLPPATKDVLKVAACLGSVIDTDLVERVLRIQVEDIMRSDDVEDFVRFDSNRRKFVFGHESVQEAARRLVPASELDRFHLQIGRRLWRSLDADDSLDSHLFVVLWEIYYGRSLLQNEMEKSAVSTLCLQAGRKAAQASTFRTASVYLNFGIDLLGSRGWVNEYELTLALHNAAAEMDLCTTRFEHMDELVGEVLRHARRDREKVPAYATKIYGLSASKRPIEALDTAVLALASIGENIPSDPSTLQLLWEAKAVKKMLIGKSDNHLLLLPTIVDEDKLAAMQILQLIYINAYITRIKLAGFVALRMMKLTLRFGLSVFASSAFVYFGVICASALGDVDEGFRFGNLGIQLLQQFGAIEHLPRVYGIFYGLLYAQKKPLKGCLEPLLRGHRVGLQTGDFEFSCFNANIYCFTAFESGTPLGTVDRMWSGFCDIMRAKGQQNVAQMSLPLRQAIHHFMGLSADPLSPQGDLFDYDAILKVANEGGNKVLSMGARFCRSFVAYVFNDYALAASSCVSMSEFRRMPLTQLIVTFRLIASLVAVQTARQKKRYWKNLRFAKLCVKKMKRYATFCPQNSLDKVYLLEAEIASVRGRKAEAMEKYTIAIALARDNDFLFIHALANERAARHLHALNQVEDAEPYFRKACSSYGAWGAKRKEERLQAEVESIYNETDETSVSDK